MKAAVPTISELYEQLIRGWNDHDADAFAQPFAHDAVVVGFDGSELAGRNAIHDEMVRIFEDHETAPYVTKVHEVRSLGAEVQVLRAIAGMIPPGKSELEPSRNAHQTLVAARGEIVLFQNTPAQFHGRPELVERMTRELEASR
jgi:uncharacterized protein (TIGR02246 family)